MNYRSFLQHLSSIWEYLRQRCTWPGYEQSLEGLKVDTATRLPSTIPFRGHKTDARQNRIAGLSQAVLDARALFPDSSLEVLYDRTPCPLLSVRRTSTWTAILTGSTAPAASPRSASVWSICSCSMTRCELRWKRQGRQNRDGGQEDDFRLNGYRNKSQDNKKR